MTGDEFAALLPEHFSGGSEDAVQVMRVIGFELSRLKGETDGIPGVMDIESCPPQFLPLIAQMMGVTNFPLLSTEGEQRRFLRLYMEALRYKGTLYALQLLFKGLFGIPNIRISQMYKNIFTTWSPPGNSIPPSTTWELGDEQTQLDRSAGIPVDYHLISDLYYPTMLVIDLDAVMDSELTGLTQLITYARTIIGEFIPEVCNWELQLTTLTGVEEYIPPVLIEDIVELEAVAHEEDIANAFNWPLFIPGVTLVSESILMSPFAEVLTLSMYDTGGLVSRTIHSTGMSVRLIDQLDPMLDFTGFYENSIYLGLLRS